MADDELGRAIRGNVERAALPPSVPADDTARQEAAERAYPDDAFPAETVREKHAEVEALRAENAQMLQDIEDDVALDTAKADLAAALAREGALRKQVAAGDASDGHHTHNELYDYRMLYNAHAAHGWLAAGLPVVKSHHHSDGEPCFGGGWFIVTATLPTGQVSNHYRDEHWDLFHVPEVDLPPGYDGHTPADAADRLRVLLVEPGGEG